MALSARPLISPMISSLSSRFEAGSVIEEQEMKEAVCDAKSPVCQKGLV
jgi:hypothetical protein